MDSHTAEILRRAVPMAQAGQLNEAKALAVKGLADGGDMMALNAFLGMIAARQGCRDEAIAYLRIAHEHKPDDITVACNLIAILIEAEDMPSAIAVATEELAGADTSMRIARYRAFLAQSLAMFEDAVRAYEMVIARDPEDFESLNNLGNARGALGDVDGAVEALGRAVALEPAVAPARLNLATALAAAGRFADAEGQLKTLLEMDSKDARALHALYLIHKEQGRNADALGALESAVRIDPENANLQLKLGIEYGEVMRIADSEAAFRKAIGCDARMSEAYLGLAIQYEHSNREDEFAPLIALAEKNDVDPETRSFLAALEYRRAGQFQQALDCLDNVSAAIEPERVSHIKATLLDRMGRSEEALAAFEETAAMHQANPSVPLVRAAHVCRQLADELDLLTEKWVAGWQDADIADSVPDPVFLVGFPRSGTTLLDTILMGHEEIHVMEERPPLNHVDRQLGGMPAIPAMNAGQIAEARAQYFKAAQDKEGWDGKSLLIDKSPLFLQKVPLIHRLFPRARFILALRDPRDVLLSCYMSNFRLNDAMSNFLRLEDAAEYYDLTFRHWSMATAMLPVKIHNIRYENLVEDAQAEIRPLFDFLGLGWNPAVLDHQRTAKARGLITTASYSQVAEPIYKRATGRWIRYEEALRPIMGVLSFWVEKFGY